MTWSARPQRPACHDRLPSSGVPSNGTERRAKQKRDWAIAYSVGGPIFCSWGAEDGCWPFESPELCRAAPWGMSCCHLILAGFEDDLGVAETQEPELLACALDGCTAQATAL